MAPATSNVRNIPSVHFTSVVPSSTLASFYLADGLPGSGIPQDVYFKGGSFCISVVAFSAIGYLYRSKNKARKSRSGLRDLLLPAVVTRDNSNEAPAWPAAKRLTTDISAPCLVSSTNAALDPCYFESHTPHQLHSSVEVSPIACLSMVEFSDTFSDTTQTGLIEAGLRHLHASTISMEHSQPLPICHSRIGEFQHIPDMESFYRSDSADSEHHSYIFSMSAIPRIALEDLSEDSTISVKKTYDFNITSVGASVRQGDFLELPDGSWPRASLSRPSSSPRGTRRRRGVQVVHIAKYTDALSTPVCRLPAFEVAHEDSLESRKQSEDETENQASNILLEFIEDGSGHQQSDLSCASKENENCTRTQKSNGVLAKSSPVYPGLELPAVVHFHGKHRRSRAASYQIAPGTLTERGQIIDFRPFSESSGDSRWAPKNGMMVIKVYIPSTDDVWAAYVPTSITLSTFTCIWLSKLSLHLRFSGSAMDTPEYYFDSDEVFQYWVKRRIRHGRNLPIVGHLDYAVLPLPFVPKES